MSPKKVDAFFQERIDSYKSGKDLAGHIVLEHELNSATVNMSMFWLPRIQSVFNVIPALACNGVTQPYWETSFVYPISNSEKPPATFTTKPTTRTSVSVTPTQGGCVPGSFGLGLSDGYSGYCCQTEQDCLDDCIGGSCNGIYNPVLPTTTTTTRTTTTTTKVPTKTTTKSVTKTTTKAYCISGVSGKKDGSGRTGYCCTTSDDCLAVCRSGTCNI